MPSLLPCAAARAIGARTRDRDALGRHVVIVDKQPRGRRAGDDDARAPTRAPRARSSRKRFRLGRRQPGFQRQRMMHQRDQRIALAQLAAPPPAARRTPARRSTIGQSFGTPASCVCAAARLGVRARARKAVAEIDHIDLPAELLAVPRSCGGHRHSRRSASRDRPAPRNATRFTTSGASYQARATCDSRDGDADRLELAAGAAELARAGSLREPVEDVLGQEFGRGVDALELRQVVEVPVVQRLRASPSAPRARGRCRPRCRWHRASRR